MAEKVIIHRIDDLTGNHSEDVEPIEFSVDGVDYEIDLSGHNADKLRDSLAGFIRVARKKAATSSANSSGSNTKDDKAKALARKERIQAIRDWAKNQPDIEVSGRGRIPDAVEKAYDKAMTAVEDAASPAPDVVVEAEIVESDWEAAVPVPAFSG
jgi:hypothetical protein